MMVVCCCVLFFMLCRMVVGRGRLIVVCSEMGMYAGVGIG